MRKLISRLSFLMVMAAVLLLTACYKPKKEDPAPDPDKSITDLVIPAAFNFNTSQEIRLNITDIKSGVIYDVYTLENDAENYIEIIGEDTLVHVDDLNFRVASGITENNSLTLTFSVPTYHKILQIVRNDKGLFSRENVQVSSQINYQYSGFFKAGRDTDNTIYSVNSSKQFYAIDAVTGVVSDMGQLPVGSITNAVDKVNRRMYFANNKSPYQLYYYDLDQGTYHQTGNLVKNFPRMDYNHDDGYLYISDKRWAYTVDPSTGQYINLFSIDGIDNKGWGDLAFTEDGDLYFATKEGIYSSTINGNIIQATKISPGNLPTPLTSAAFDDDEKLWVKKSGNSDQVILFDITDGSWEYKTLSQKIKVNDFSSLSEITIAGDTDGDGVTDDQDDYPTDPTKAFNNYYPGDGAKASLAFEDLWPGVGDYDFNDLVMYYTVNQITNGQNKVAEIAWTFEVIHIGATLDNGFGIELNTSTSNISSVTGTSLTEGYITLAANGVEANQTNAVAILFDNADLHLGETMSLVVSFGTPVSPASLGGAPYNPFLIKDGERGYEIHLPDKAPTDLANQAIFGTYHDDSNPATGRYYKTEVNLPWAINIIYEFVYPLEKQEITKGYLKFGEWAESGGSVYDDWYKDLSGYRDDAYLSD